MCIFPLRLKRGSKKDSSDGVFVSSGRHLRWIVYGSGVGFGASFVFGDLLPLPVDLYYLIYFLIVGGFFVLYARTTSLDVREVFARRLGWGILFGLVVGAVVVMNVISRPETEHVSGARLAWMVFWRGLACGAVDGLLLTGFPWLVTWRAFDVQSKPVAKKIGYTFVAWIFVLVMTTAYHAGYAEFRSAKMVQPNIGNSLISLATFASGNPAASMITHAAMHVAAVVHSPQTELYLPPHR
jgi:hypothetical protein